MKPITIRKNPPFTWKKRGTIFFAIFAGLWLFLEPLSVFGLAKNLLESAGIIGYGILLFFSIFATMLIEFLECTKASGWYKRFFTYLFSFLKRWARAWKFNLTVLLLLLLEITSYLLLRDHIVILLSLLYILFIGFVFKLFQNKSSTEKEQTSNLCDILTSHLWTLVYRPLDHQTKPISFLHNGEIGDGRNQNENKWRVQDGKLEILQSDGQVHSRFNFLKGSTCFTHTNDEDTFSIRSQIINIR